MALNYMRIMEAGGDYARMDYIAAGFGILLTLEAARRVVGLPIVCLATFSALLLFGAYFPVSCRTRIRWSASHPHVSDH
jgi:TRAP-type uncharacterized transport system fused permease subunit